MRGLILELKHVQKESELEEALTEVTSQIVKKRYESILQYEGYTTCLKYGLAFCDKQCKIR